LPSSGFVSFELIFGFCSGHFSVLREKSDRCNTPRGQLRAIHKSETFQNSLDLRAMDRHVSAAEGEPTMRVHGTKPWMRKFRRGLEIPDVADGG
jgi:hypothetical protein